MKWRAGKDDKGRDKSAAVRHNSAADRHNSAAVEHNRSTFADQIP